MRKHRDPVTKAVHDFVLKRDGGCVAAKIDPAHACRDQWSNVHGPHVLRLMTLDHIKKEPGMGFRSEINPETGQRESMARWLVTLCYEAHLATNWATSHRPELREYLKGVSE